MTSIADLLEEQALLKLQQMDLDPQSEAMIEVQCSECPSAVLIDPQITNPICVPCARKRIVSGQPVEIIHNPGGPTLFDIDSISDAELGALVRQRIKATKATEIVAASPQVVAERAKKKAESVVAVAERQAERRKQVYPGFTVGSLEVPALDLTNVADLNELTDGVARSPYNKARYRLKIDGSLDAETCTWAVLAEQHETLAALVAANTEPKAKKKKAKKAKVVLAVTEPDDDALEAKVKALAKILNVSKKQARELVSA